MNERASGSLNDPLWNPPLTLCWAAIFGAEHREPVKSLREAGVLVMHDQSRDKQGQRERSKDARNDHAR